MNLEVMLNDIENIERSLRRLKEYIALQLSLPIETTIEAYVDGSYSQTTQRGGYAIRALCEEKIILDVYGQSIESTTSARAELMAAIMCLRYLQSGNLTIYSDLQYLVQGINEWSKDWIKNNWKKAGGQPVENIDLWKQLIIEKEQHRGDLKIVWIKGHTDNPHHEHVDYQAKFATRV